MGTLLKARAQKDEFLEAYLQLSSVAEQRREIEYVSACKMQSAFRMYRARKRYRAQRRGTIDFQRSIRGFLGRRSYAREQLAKASGIRSRYFARKATIIQAAFRGFVSRKYVQDFHARKKYIAAIAHQGEVVRQELQRHYERTAMEMQEQAEQQALRKFQDVMQHTSHLRSTKAQPSVYASPYAVGMEATIMAVPVESHLGASARIQAKQRLQARKRFDWEAALVTKTQRQADTINTEQMMLQQQRALEREEAHRRTLAQQHYDYTAQLGHVQVGGED